MSSHRLFVFAVSLGAVMAFAPPKAAETSDNATVPESSVASSSEAVQAGGLWDRARMGQSAGTIPASHVGLEAGMTLEATGDEGEIQLPEALIRVGVVSFLELRATLPSVSLTNFSDPPTPTSGALGFKIGGVVTPGFGLSLVSSFDVPTQSETLELFASRHTLNVLYDFSRSTTLALTGTAALTQPLSGEDQALRWQSGGALAFLGHLDASGFVYVEGYGLIDHEGDVEYGMGLGLSYSVDPRLNLDLGFEYGNGPEGNRVALTSGLSVILN